MSTPNYVKDPDAVLDYEIDWSPWLAVGETITASTWVVPPGITAGIGPQGPSHTDTTATLWLSGGTLDRAYRVTNRITTSVGRVDDRSLLVAIVAR